MYLDDYEQRLERPTKLKLPDFERNGRLKHVLFADQFDRRALDHLTRVASMVRDLARSKDTAVFLSELLPHKRAMLYFSQVSTRTYLSFVAACQLLGMPTAEIRDPSVSSEYKGESPLDSMRMFSSYFDVVIMRSRLPQFAECCAYLMNDLDHFNQRNVPVINGGSGADEHPTQALLDMFTIQRSLEFRSERDSSQWTQFDEYRSEYPDLARGPDNKSYLFCGDIGRGRTVRSLAILLSKYSNVSMHFVAPPHPKLKLPQDLRERLLAEGVSVYEHDRLEAVIDQVDLLYMTRVQHEHDTEADASYTVDLSANCYLTAPLVARMREYAPILHPFPRNDEIPHRVDLDHRAMYFHQARNGMWMRAALLAYMFDVDSQIVSAHADTFSDFHSYNEAVL